MPIELVELGSSVVKTAAFLAGGLALVGAAALPTAVVLWMWRLWLPQADHSHDSSPAPVPADREAPAGCVRHASRQMIGARTNQEDSFGFIDSPVLDPAGRHPVAIVADGMGGHARGDMASRLAVRSFVTAYADTGTPADRLQASLEKANEAIAEAVTEDPSLEGMGTTLVAAALTSNGLEWISVGDSPMYLFRGKHLKRLNEDHSMVPVIAAMREMQMEIAKEINPHELRSALVGCNIDKIDTSPLPELLQAGDLVLLASDGIDTLDSSEAASILDAHRHEGPEAIATALLEAVTAHASPTQDNVTVILIEVPDGTGTGATGGTPAEDR